MEEDLEAAAAAEGEDSVGSAGVLLVAVAPAGAGNFVSAHA